MWEKQPPEVFCKNRYSEKCRKIQGKHLCQSLLFNKVADLSPATLLKRRLRHTCFPVNFAKFLITPFLQKTSRDCFWYVQCTQLLGVILLPTLCSLVLKSWISFRARDVALFMTFFYQQNLLKTFDNLLTKCNNLEISIFWLAYIIYLWISLHNVVNLRKNFLLYRWT